MPSPAGTQSAAVIANASGIDRKRKRSSRQTAEEEESPSRSKQHTLQSVFAAQQKPHLSKRPSPDTLAPPSIPLEALALRDMYTFASRAPPQHAGGLIDLTSASPPTSPQSGRVNAAAKRASAAGAPTGAKKLVVKNLKTNTSWDSKAYLEKIWGQLDEALTVIFKDGENVFSREDLYRGVENVCRQAGASTLYSRLEQRCRTHVELDMHQPLAEKADEDSAKLLERVLSAWSKWKEQMTTIRGIFFFLDRSYLLPSSKPTLSELTPLLFRDIIVNSRILKEPIVAGACQLVSRDRANAQDPSANRQALFKQAVDLFHNVSTYSSSFEPAFLTISQTWIAQWSDHTIVEKAVPDYVALADVVISTEMCRCDEYALDNGTRRDLLALLEDHIIERKIADLTEYEALGTMLDNNATSDLTALYALLNRRRKGMQLRPSFEKWVDETGTSIVFASDSDKMIVHLLSLKRRLDSIWQNSFQKDHGLGIALRDTFATFMNKTKKGDATWGTDNTKVGEMIAKYVDQLLRGGAKAIPDVLTARRASSITGLRPTVSLTSQPAEDDNEDDEVDEDEEINIQLDQVLDLFRFVQGKAVFEAFYKKDLARRLLMGRSASADAERSMLTRLKAECGSAFTQNLEQMFKDVELAREEMQSYKQRLEDRIGWEKSKNVDLSVNILSAAAWPSYPDIPVAIPANIHKAINDFELHYKSKHSGRKLDWKHALANCQMRATFPKGNKELVVSSFQAIVLLLFNGLKEDERLDYPHILSQTGLPEPEVNRTLQSLACVKSHPLTKHPKSKDISKTDTFSINPSFDSPKYRVKINQIQLKETKEENKETHIRVAEDRNFECQAAIVRILKSRKKISHSELVSEVIKATISRGVLGVGDIKKNIDRLIEKDYMEREDGNTYSYIA